MNVGKPIFIGATIFYVACAIGLFAGGASMINQDMPAAIACFVFGGIFVLCIFCWSVPMGMNLYMTSSISNEGNSMILYSKEIFYPHSMDNVMSKFEVHGIASSAGCRV